MAKNYAYLVMVNANNNNNKFYEITENNDNSLDVRYGRIGMKGVERHYEPYEKTFRGLVNEKTAKGYQDNTMYHAKKETVSKGAAEALSYKPVENEDVQQLMSLLISSSREFMQTHYSVKAVQITEKAIIDAEQDISELIDIANSQNRNNKLYDFNCKLEEDLFHRIERNMGDVSSNLAHTEDDFERIIQREQQMLDNLKGIIEQEKKMSSLGQDAKDKTYLEANGLSIRPVTYKEEDQIISHLGRDYQGLSVERRFVQGFSVENERTRQNYEKYKQDKHIDPKTVKLFYHGSKVENWNSIITQGMSLNPNASITGKMFGNGLYFAPESRKSLNYMDTKGSHWNNGTRDTGYMGVYAVALGKSYEPSRPSSTMKPPHGYDSVFASKHNRSLGLQNDEYIVYSQDACTIKYLLEMKSNNAPELEFELNRKALRDKLSDSFGDLTKTPQGFRCEISLEQLPAESLTEITSKITDGYDCNRLYIDYNAKRDTISLSAEDVMGNSIDIYPNLTKHDYKFLAREMKKTFAESEVEWKQIVKNSADIPTGKTVISKTSQEQEQEQSEHKKHKSVKAERD